MIKAENISYSIKGKNLLHGISLSFNPDEISMIIGPNGAGKSTLIKLLSQQISCTSGNIQYNNRDMKLFAKSELAKVRAVLSQNTHMVFPLSVEEVVMMGRYPHFHDKPTRLDKEICEQTMAFFKVDEMAKRNYLTLSGGEQQRVHFARVTAQIWPDNTKSTKVLLLDEPLTYLDIYYQHEFLTILKQLMQLQSMVIIGVVHDLNLAYKFADKVTLLSKGNLLAHGNTELVCTKENIKKAFLIEPSILKNEKGERFLCF
ncbi:MAG: heme ABC transporter ATP-binding protein [Saprospiraceae bacterium]|nr:heme ABC transporter ATP-binding protein [Saprospiraceae bacterium]